MKEIWKPTGILIYKRRGAEFIYCDNYSISNLGRVHGLNGILKNCMDGCGYHKVSIKGKHMKVHRLVAQAFIHNPENKPCVAHRDNNKINNRVDNLYWATYQENALQAFRDGLCKPINIIMEEKMKSFELGLYGGTKSPIIHHSPID